MDLFRNSTTVRLKNHHEKYLVAGEDQETVFQDRDGSTRNAHWTVEIVDEEHACFKSCYGKYLTASSKPFLPGLRHGRNLKVVQTLPDKLNSSVQWKPVRAGDGESKVSLKTRHDNVLQSNGGPPPWRNSVTHDIPRKSDKIRKKVLWQVEVVEAPSDQWREYDSNIISKTVYYVRNAWIDFTKKKKKNKESSDSVKDEGSKATKAQQSSWDSVRGYLPTLPALPTLPTFR